MSQQTTPYDLRQHGKVYRITVDPAYKHERFASDKAWLYRIPCEYGHIYIHGANCLGASTSSSRMCSRLLALPGVTRHQVGDGEASVTFPPELLDQVCDLLHAKKRRKPLSPEARAALVAMGVRSRFGRTANLSTSEPVLSAAETSVDPNRVQGPADANLAAEATPAPQPALGGQT